jgi:CRP-like cAMP-binding protein
MEPAQQLLLKSRTELYAPDTYLARAGEIADRLMVVMSGQVYVRPTEWAV